MSSNAAVASTLKSLWWLFLVRGIVGIAFGLVALFAPLTAAGIFALIFAIYALVDGVVELVQAVVAARAKQKYGWYVFQGLISIAAGIVVLVWPQASVATIGVVLLWIIAIYTVLFGIVSLFSGGEGGSRVWSVILGIVAIIAGIWIAVWTITDTKSAVLGLVWVIGLYALIAGIVLTIISFQIRKGKGAVFEDLTA
jgi:uncharacterized membrane protein HdeD (DUF308 family)